MTPEELLSSERVADLRRRARLVGWGVGAPVAVLLLGLAAYSGDAVFAVLAVGSGALLGGIAGSLSVMPALLGTLRWSFTFPGLDRRGARRAVRAIRRDEPELVAAEDLPVVVRSAEVRLRVNQLSRPTWAMLGGAAVTQVPVLLGAGPEPDWRRALAGLAWVLVAVTATVAFREHRALERFVAGTDRGPAPELGADR